MRFTRRYTSSLLLAAILAAPVAIIASPVPNDEHVQVRIFDSKHKDFHNWDDRENNAWGIYLTTNHKKNREYSKSSKREQSNYWNWRHSHPDHD